MPEIAAAPPPVAAKVGLACVPLNREFHGSRTHRDKKVRAPSVGDPAHWRSKSPTGRAQAAQFVLEPPKRSHAHRFREAQLASRFRLLPNNASAHRGKAKMAPLAVPHGRHARRPRAKLFGKFPVLCARRPASRNKSDKVAVNFVAERAR